MIYCNYNLLKPKRAPIAMDTTIGLSSRKKNKEENFFAVRCFLVYRKGSSYGNYKLF